METNNNTTNNNNNSDNSTQSTHELTAKQLKRQRIRQVAVSLIGVAILVWGIVKIACMFMDYKSNEKSDDAQIEQYISPVNMRASGYIKRIYFKEHQDVKKGDTLLVLDDREYRIRVMEAEAALKDAMAGANVIDASVQTTQTSATVYEASIAEIEIRLAKLEKDRQRYQNLVARNAATPIQLEQIETEYNATKKKLDAVRRQQKAAYSGVNEVQTRKKNTAAAIERAQAALEMAKLNLSYCVVTAPCDGKLGRRALEEGQLVNAGQTITYIMPNTQKWVIANYKETQVEKLYVGQKVKMSVDAFKFTPTAGHILLSLTHTDHHAYISIKDSGIGIPKDKLETIFQRFYQSPSDPNDRNIGTGIGLDLTRSLVELHYGSISARNNEGEKGSKFEHGSEFIIRIPLGKDHLKPEELIAEEEVKEKQNLELAEVKQLEQEVKETENAEKSESAAVTTDMQSKLPASARGNKAEIVIVEDEEDIQDYLKAQLASDFKIRTYPNGKVALNEILKNKPDLIISDVMMPEMDGTTLCTKLKANINTNDVPIILLTAKSREEDQLEGLQTGADAYILKPFNMDILRRTIINLLTMRRTLKNKFTGKESQEEKVEQRKIQTPDDALMQRVMEVINENIGDSDLSVDMIAQKVGISRVHLHRKMKELTNQTPHSFIRNIRLQQAAKLLKDGKQSITDVMYICGFSNSASFSTMFKNLYGCSPREYMQNAIKE